MIMELVVLLFSMLITYAVHVLSTTLFLLVYAVNEMSLEANKIFA